VVIPLATQHCLLLQRNLGYTGVIRASRWAEQTRTPPR